MLSNQETNTELLNQYYNCITNKRLFENIIDSQNELYFYPQTQKWKLDRNNDLLKNDFLQTRIELLTIYNNLIGSLMQKIVSNFKLVNEWKKSNNSLHESGLMIRLSNDLNYLKEQFPNIIKLNKSSDLLLAYQIKEYCINLIEIMISYLKSNLCIDLVNSPIYSSIEKLKTDIENTVDFGKVKFDLKAKKRIQVEPQQNKLENKLNWQGTQLEFTEIFKALIQSNKLNAELNQKETFNRLKDFFNVSEYNENEKMKDIRNRTNTLTPFINTLETSLSNWIKAKD